MCYFSPSQRVCGGGAFLSVFRPQAPHTQTTHGQKPDKIFFRGFDRAVAVSAWVRRFHDGNGARRRSGSVLREMAKLPLFPSIEAVLPWLHGKSAIGCYDIFQEGILHHRGSGPKRTRTLLPPKKKFFVKESQSAV